MRKYVFKNATVYITEPTEAHVKNIRKATERFVQQLAKEGYLNNEHKRKSNRRTGINDINARKRNRKITKEN